MAACDICASQMVEKRWKVDFLIEGKFISVLNYPLLLCPKCAKMDIREKVHEKILEKLYLNSKVNKMNLSAIKFEEHF